jgi:hypothetical protein
MQCQDERGKESLPQAEKMDLPQMRQGEISDQKEKQK